MASNPLSSTVSVAVALGLLFVPDAEAAGLVCHPQHVLAIAVGDGPEDLAWEARRSRLLISSARRSQKDRNSGRIQALAIPLAEAGIVAKSFAVDLEIVRPECRGPFYPVGISLLEPGEGRGSEPTHLYVIVSGYGERGPHSVEKFLVEQNRLVFVESFGDKLLVEPNDVVALPGDELYVSNASGHHGVARTFEQVFKKRWSTVAHHKDKRWSVAARGLAFPNGLAIEDGGRRLRVAAFNERRLFGFRRDLATGTLELIRKDTVRLSAHPDNLMVVGDHLLVAAHPNRRKTLANIRDPRKPAPSVVYRLAAGSTSAETLYQDDGTFLAASSTAFINGNVLYVSQVARASLLVCPLIEKR